MTDLIRQREEQMADQILANEALTADLDDAAAQGLLEWALSAAHRVAVRTAGMNESEASQLMDEAQPAVRRLMRAVRGLAAQWETLGDAERQAYMDQVAEQAPLVYGPGHAPRPQEELIQFTPRAQAGRPEPAALIANLRTFVESRWASPEDDRRRLSRA